jgi:protein involved in polysaccharide export with SLBB domain
MRITSSAESTGRPFFCFALGLAAALLLSTPSLRAQCSGDDPDSLACQMQQPLPSSTQSSASPAIFDISPAAQSQPRADRSNDASANGSLTGGSEYTESALPPNRRPSQAAQPSALPPEPPTEFQRFVQSTTGQMLPVYGAALFDKPQPLFGPVDNAPAPENLLVAPGDELRIRIWGQVNFSANLRVSREGEIYLPKVGSVHVAGLPLAAAQDHLRQALDRIYRNYEISVDMGAIHSIQIYVTGEARRPGEYTVSALNTLVDAVFSTGGPSGAGSMRHVELKRDGKVITDFDLYTLLVEGDKTGDAQLQPGDILYFPPAGPQVALLGSVRQAGIYELRGTGSLASVIHAAGGLTAMAQGAHIAVDRISAGGNSLVRLSAGSTEEHAQRSAFELSADAEGLATPLADGDIVRIEAIASDYRQTVTLRGSIANPGRYRWRAGMHLSDIMPDRDALVSRDYWWRRTQLGLPAPEFVAAPSTASNQPSRPSQTSHQPAAGGFTSDGESGEPSASALPALASPADQTDWSHAVVERLDPATMKTSLLSFDLGKLVLAHDPSQDLELRPGDVITVFSEDDVRPPIDQQTKYIQLQGEVVNAGVYSIGSGDTLRSIVERAGGLTHNAYLYGAEFTRKSTQQLEQERLHEYADRLEHGMDRDVLALGAASLEQGAQAPGQNGLQPANRALVSRLHQMRATGRIVLGIPPSSASAADLPAIPLEDGDTLIVPPIPSTIQVIGSVFNQNAFLYRSNARVGSYLHLAGGPTRDADRNQTFVLRANGSVLSRSAGTSIFASSDFDNLRLYPGDTVVVPEKLIRPSGLRSLAAWTGMLYQYSLSAAAVDAVK